MKRYFFTVTLSGIGKDESEAWSDAVDQFAADPGEPDTAKLDDDQWKSK